MSNKIQFTLKVCVATAIILILLQKADFFKIKEIVRIANIYILVSAMLTFVMSIAINTFRLKILYETVGGITTYLELLKINFIGLFFSVFLPGRTAGDFIRGYYMMKIAIKKESVISTILVWRIIGLLTMLIIASITSIASYPTVKNENILVTVLSTFIIFILIFAVLNIIEPKKLKTIRINKGKTGITSFIIFINKVLNSFLYYKNEKILLANNILISILSNSLIIATWFLISISINASIPAIIFVLFIPMVSILQAIPISLNGIGVRETAAVFLFGIVGVQMDVILAVSLIFSGLSIIISLVGGIAYLGDRNKMAIVN